MLESYITGYNVFAVVKPVESFPFRFHKLTIVDFIPWTFLLIMLLLTFAGSSTNWAGLWFRLNFVFGCSFTPIAEGKTVRQGLAFQESGTALKHFPCSWPMKAWQPFSQIFFVGIYEHKFAMYFANKKYNFIFLNCNLNTFE